jgi:hypothetical protein
MISPSTQVVNELIIPSLERSEFTAQLPYTTSREMEESYRMPCVLIVYTNLPE